MKSHLWTKPRGSSRCTFSGGSGVRVTIGTDRGTLPPIWDKKRGKIEPKGLSDKLPQTQPCDRASAKPAPDAVRAAHTKFVAALAGHPPRPIPLEADAIDLEDRADHLDTVLRTLSVYLAAVLDETAQNVPSRLDLRDVEGILADLASDVTGAIQQAADDMAGRPA
jgi:hypothetical protein